MTNSNCAMSARKQRKILRGFLTTEGRKVFDEMAMDKYCGVMRAADHILFMQSKGNPFVKEAEHMCKVLCYSEGICNGGVDDTYCARCEAEDKAKRYTYLRRRKQLNEFLLEKATK